MRLLELPRFVFDKIAAYLGPASIAAMGPPHHQLRENIELPMEHMKLKEITESTLGYLDRNGVCVRYLDLSGCVSNYRKVESVVLKCQCVKELNLVNSNFATLSALSNSHELETLSLTAVDGVYYILPSDYQLMKKHSSLLMCCSVRPFIVREKFPLDCLASSSLGSVKKIYIETVPGEQQMVFTMCFLNLCHNVEAIHINVYGRSRHEVQEDILLPELAAHHWETVHTVVVTRHLSKRGSAKSIMKAIFAHHTANEIRRWINRDQECYIYEYGQFNGDSCSAYEANSDMTLLRQFNQVDLSSDRDATSIFASPWGLARSARITGYLLGASSCLEERSSSTLTELDITKCHGDFTNRFRVRLLTALPALEVLACSLCVFALLDHTAYREESESREAYERLKQALHGLRLKKVFIGGCLHANGTRTTASCFCPDGLHCSRCSHQQPLKSSEFVDLGELSHLEELTVRDVDLETSSFHNLGNSTLHTLKLCLRSDISDIGLKRLIQKSRNLIYLKLEAPELKLTSPGLLMALSGAENLRQLCLRTESTEKAYGRNSAEFGEYIAGILRELEVLHLHCYFPLFDEVSAWNGKLKCKIRHYNPSPYDECSRQRPGSIGRGLCFAESSVGVVPPIGWEVD